MRNLSLADREWLHRIHVDANPRNFNDSLMLRAMGVCPLSLNGASASDGISRLLHLYVRDGREPESLMEKRDEELRRAACITEGFVQWSKRCMENNIDNLLAAYERQAKHEEADILACAERIAQHEAPGIPEDDTVRWLRRAGVPVTAENWMRLQFMGNPPLPPLDGELLAELPSWVRAAYEPEEEESAEPVCELDDEDAEGDDDDEED